MLKNVINNQKLTMMDHQRMRLMFYLEKASEDIYEWKAHIFCNVKQEEAKETALRNSKKLRQYVSVNSHGLGIEVFAHKVL